MTVYLVDFENVRSEGLRGVEDLSEEDKVVIFYSKNADAITFDVVSLLNKSMAEIETYRILRGGHNSLDFQLATYLGYLVMENSFKEIVIVSKDKGFLCVTSFWKENEEKCNADIKLCKTIGEAKEDIEIEDESEDGLSGSFIEKINTKQPVKKKIQNKAIPYNISIPANSKKVTTKIHNNKMYSEESNKDISDDVKKIINGKYDENLVPVIVETLGKSTGKQHFYRMMVSKLGQKDGLDLYKLIRQQYVNLKRK